VPKGKKKDEEIIEEDVIIDDIAGDDTVADIVDVPLPAVEFDGPALEDLDDEDIDTDEDLLAKNSTLMMLVTTVYAYTSARSVKSHS